MVRVFPLGHPVELETSHAKAIELAERRWGRADRVFDVKPLRFAICVVDGAATELQFCPKAEGFKFEGVDCVTEFDRAAGKGYIRSTVGSLEHMMEAAIFTALTWTFFIGVHAGCVKRDGRSVLLCGDSGAGKSTLAFACGLAGWTVVSDNSLYWADSSHDVLVSPGAPVKLRDGARAMFGEKANTQLAVATIAPPGPLVFLERRPGPVAATRKTEDEVFSYMDQYGWRPDEEYVRKRRRALLRDGAWTLKYERVEDAVAWLGSLT